MASSADQYAREIHEKLEFWATWLPGTRVKLGDCGTVDNFVFNRRSSLSSFGVEFSEDDRGGLGDLLHQSVNVVAVEFHVAGESQEVQGLAGNAGATVKFHRGDAVLFAAKKCAQTEIADLNALERDLKAALKDRDFPAHYVVVTAVVRASSATVLISQGKGAGITLRAGADIGLSGIADLASAEAKLSVVRNHNLATQYVAETDVTPLFKVMGFGTNWYNGMPKQELESMGGDDTAGLPDVNLDLSAADFDEYARYAEGFDS